jgi:outer membrane protein OmpA-like peptidoglycan-associated protein
VPDDPEDKGGFEDGDSCSDPDNDKDRILDRLDKCPNEPETYNGFEDEDGCPDRGRVIVTDTAIEILDRVCFANRGDKIRAESLPIVDAIAATLVGNPTSWRIEIGGHAAGNEPDASGLASRRAGAVRAALIKHGSTAAGSSSCRMAPRDRPTRRPPRPLTRRTAASSS